MDQISILIIGCFEFGFEDQQEMIESDKNIFHWHFQHPLNHLQESHSPIGPENPQ